MERTLDRLAGSWQIYQLRRGHRFATDDVLVAWTAHRAHPQARRLLDLGAGVGSVGLMTLRVAPPSARLTCIEIQPISVELLGATVRHNDLDQRVTIHQADLRKAGPMLEDARFELTTANPPYLKPGAALRSPHPQRAAARLELHGDIFDYCRAARRWLAPGGRFCFSHAAGDPRPEAAVAEAGMRLLCRQPVIPRTGRAALIALYTCGLEGSRADRPPLTIRSATGRLDRDYRAVRREMRLDE
jgi:tRNA1(Val) A37 N6-methylase TrmN6